MVTPSTLPSPTGPKHQQAVISKKDRRLQFFKLSIIAFVSLATVVLTSRDVAQTAKIYKMKQNLREKVKISIETASIIHNLQKERGLTALFLVMKLRRTHRSKKKMEKFRRDTDESIRSVKEWGNSASSKTEISNSVSFLKALKSFRSKVDNKSENVQVTRHLHTYSSWINELISWLPQHTAEENLEDYAHLVFGYQMIIQSKEEAGLERALGGMYFIQGKNFGIANTSWYNEKRIRANGYLSTAFSFSTEVKKIYNELINNKKVTSWMQRLKAKRDLLVFGYISKPSKSSAQAWFDLMTQYSNLMLEVQMRIANLIQHHVKDEIKMSLNSLVIRSLLLCFTLIVVPCIIFSLVKVQKAFYEYTLSLIDKVDLEQGRTEFLMNENARYVEGE